uniref:Putative nuclear matrix constituent protein 1-like protein n=1 Tax=Noccaea caerulescens TaxID=107243 RepID=A0A1J3EUN8_NOCCA
MFTLQKNPWSSTDRKGKSVAFADEITTPSPPMGFRREDDSRFGAAMVDDWRKFKEVGLLDEASLERKDIDALLEKNLKLEKELFDYQHNMGLLLIEKKKWTSENEKLQQAFDEANEILKRERTSNLIALNESEKREEKLRKSLISEKQFAAELERDLKYLQQEHSVVKSTSEAKLAEANALVMGTKENSLEVDRKRALAEEKLAVISRKSSELEKKLKDVETHEKLLQREHLSLVTEREAHEAVFYKQREDLSEWEKKLTLEEKRLSEAKRSIDHIEERNTESERSIKKKEKTLGEMQQKTDIAKSELKEREEVIKVMLDDIFVKEKEFEAMKTKVDMKEKELHELEEKLIAREQIEMGKLLDDQKAVLNSRRQEFEMELKQMRISLDGELEKMKGEIEQLRDEISHKGEQLGKREESVKEKEKELEARLKAVKEKEKSLKTEEKKLHMENERLLEDKESLRKLKDEIEEIGAETTKQESRIRKDHESLKITKEERLQFLRLQSELKQQIDRVKQDQELLLKEREELKQDKGKFEKEWEALDEKKTDISREQKEVTEEKEKLRILQISEKHRLQREEMMTSRDNVKKELDDVEDLEKQRRNLDMELQKQEEHNDNITYVKMLAEKEMEELQYEKLALNQQREEISVEKKKLKEQFVDLFKDVGQVDELRISLKEQRDELCSAKERFIVFLRDIKICDVCSVKFKKFIHPNRVADKLSEDSKSTSLIATLAAAKQPEDSLHTSDIETLRRVAGEDHEPSASEQSFTESKIKGGPAVSLQSEIKSDKPRRGRAKGKSVRGRSQATEAASRDSKPSKAETPRKRQREHVSRMTESEHGAGDSDDGVDSMATGGRKKKRQTAISVSQTPGQSRYYLRRHRNVGTEEDKAQASIGAIEKQESVNGDIRTVPSPEDNLTPRQGENRENGKAEILVETVTVTHEEIVEVEEETEFKDNNTGKKPVKDRLLEAERKEHGEEDDGNFSMIQEENEEEEEEETERPGEASIGKKIWVFFTT